MTLKRRAEISADVFARLMQYFLLSCKNWTTTVFVLINFSSVFRRTVCKRDRNYKQVFLRFSSFSWVKSSRLNGALTHNGTPLMRTPLGQMESVHLKRVFTSHNICLVFHIQMVLPGGLFITEDSYKSIMFILNELHRIL